MARNGELLFVLLLISTTVLAATEYCDLNYCDIDCGPKEGLGSIHVGCNVEPGLHSACPENAQIYEFTQSEIDHWLKLDNTRRNQVANGSLPGFEPAQRMPRTTWNAELALLAHYNAKVCVTGHDMCRNTRRYEHAGQSYYMVKSSNGYHPTKDVIQIVHDNWFNEHKFTSMEDIKKYPEVSDVQINDFAQIVRDKSPQFGCAATKFEESSYYTWYVVCNYGAGTAANHTVYKSGVACSECKTGCDTEFPALCGPNETINPNTF